VAGGIDNRVVVLVSEELLGVTLDGNSTVTLLLTGIKVVSESEGGLSLLFGVSLELYYMCKVRAASCCSNAIKCDAPSKRLCAES
jgi:hypothetical protein